MASDAGQNWDQRIWDTISQYEQLIETFALQAESAAQDSVRLGAAKAQMQALGELTELLQLIGLMPRTVGRFAQELALDETAGELLDLFKKWELPREAFGDLGWAIGRPALPGGTPGSRYHRTVKARKAGASSARG